MTGKTDYIAEYEDILLGKRTLFSKFVFSGSDAENAKIAGIIWRYVIDELYETTPEDARDHMTYRLITCLRLDKALKRIGVKVKSNDLPDLRCILQYAYPENPKFRYNIRTDAISEYQKIMKIGPRYENNTVSYDFPNGFFVGKEGIIRARCLLEFAVNLYMGDMSERDKYAFFANKAKAKRWLIKKKLNKPLTYIYDTPLDFYHDAIRGHDDEFLYNAFVVKQEYERKLSEMKSRKPAKNPTV